MESDHDAALSALIESWSKRRVTPPLFSRDTQEAWFRIGKQVLALFTPDRVGSGQHFAFLIPPQDAERVRQEVVAQGFLEETMQQDEGLSVYVRDPDGNKIELYGKRTAA